MSQPKNDIAAMRFARGVMAKELAADLKVSTVHLSYVENGHRHSKSLEQRAVALLSRLPVKRLTR
jgi:transcriptional regulator with XRE-family HTH domain